MGEMDSTGVPVEPDAALAGVVRGNDRSERAHV